MSENPQLDKIELLVLDVDGVLTDGRIILTASGDEAKAFNVKDGSGIKYWLRTGGKVALITGRRSEVVARRAEELGISVVRQGCKDKLPVFHGVLEELGFKPPQAAVVGDDLTDLPMIRGCGYGACPADAVEEVRDAVDYVCERPGGSGCVREVVERLLKNTGKWTSIMARYEPRKESQPT
jgi:3-deoxy-D-manno-octulosonate 8-phosphate phosphatase (KDO 8-P phosphatase)